MAEEEGRRVKLSSPGATLRAERRSAARVTGINAGTRGGKRRNMQRRCNERKKRFG